MDKEHEKMIEDIHRVITNNEYNNQNGLIKRVDSIEKDISVLKTTSGIIVGLGTISVLISSFWSNIIDLFK
jgi:hypothetical protein